MKSSKVVYLFFAIVPHFVSAQFDKPRIKFTKTLEEKYLYPINPGRPGSLAGTMGELRSTHFHSGIDIRTNNMVGLSVFASKSGYISRAIISTTGYGNVIYISHPDGNTTLYAHLDKFLGPLADHILQERYARKTSEIDLRFPKDQFPVKQGDLIAYSGNSGGSTGPHLHFDIRDSSNQALDPLKFGFSEIADKFPPAVEKIAFQTLDVNARVNDKFGRIEFHAQRVGKNYILSQPILARGNIGIELLAKDKFAVKSAFYGGVNYIDMKVDSQLVFSQAIEKLNVSEPHDVYTLMNFKTMRTKGTRFYKLYIDDGNNLKFYGNSPGSGKININGTKDSNVEIRMKDSYGNASNFTFTLRPAPPIDLVPSLEQMGTDNFFDITDNVMMVVTKTCNDSTEKKAAVFFQKNVVQKKPDYFNQYRSVYLFDLRKEIPDSIIVCGNSIVPKIKVSIPSASEYTFYSDKFDIQFPADALYDTLYLNTDYSLSKNGNEIFTIGQRTIPLDKDIIISLRPGMEYSKEKKYGIYRMAGKGVVYASSGNWTNGVVNFTTHEFGDYTILSDTIPPVIKLLYANSLVTKFKIRDTLSGISSFEASINGEWLLMNYDNKTGMIWSEKLDKNKPLKGDLELVVTDNAGNKQLFKRKIL